MRILDFGAGRGEPVSRYGSVATRALTLADGRGEAHVHCVRFEAGGRIGAHPTGFGQLFLVIEGGAWVQGDEGRRVELAAGQGAWFARGEHHAKGSEGGATVLMVQVRDLVPRPEAIRQG